MANDADNERSNLASSDAHGEARTGGDQVDSVAYTWAALEAAFDLPAAVARIKLKASSQAAAQARADDQSLVSFIPEVVSVDFMPDGSVLLLGRSPLYMALDAIRLKQEWDEYFRLYWLHNLALD